jgi:DNA-binding NarL/FixJ family response regulator
MITYRFTDKPLKLSEDELTPREARVLRALREAESPLTIREIAREAFKGQANAYFHAKNQLRRLVIGRFVKQVGRGFYATVDVAKDLGVR